MFGRDEKVSAIRLTAAQYMILAIFLILAYGLWRLQVMESGYYASAAEKNRIRNVPILAPRGKILDREGRIIVDNYPSFSALLLRDSSRDLNADSDLIAQGLHLDPTEVRTRIRHFASMPQYQPIFLKEDITPDELAFIDAHRNELPELDTIVAHRRLYPRNGFMAHLIGYVGEVTEDMLNQPQFELYNPGDVVGVSGVERQYNNALMGQNGARREVVNSHGRTLGVLGEADAVPGKQLKLTVDIDLQIAAEEALGDKNGAVVAMDPHTGEILAMVSRPTFDPNDFAVKVSRDEWNKLITDPDKPLLNKAIQAQLAPGSTFKIMMSVAGLQEGIMQNMHIVCNGGWGPYGYFHHCDEHHGAVDMYNAIPYSCDTFFYMLGDKLGIDRIVKYADAFGYGQKTGIDLPGEQAGLMPSAQWKAKTYHARWYPDETLDVSIGQGAVEATPLQLARIIGGIASGGHLVRPHVVFPDQLPEEFRKSLADSFPGSGTAYVPIDPANWEIVTDGMYNVTQPGLYHTAGGEHLDGIDFAGKTGTAQVMSHEALGKTNQGKATYPNVWFVGVTPRRNPELVVAVLWQNGNKSWFPARIGAKIVEAFVDKKRRLAGNLPQQKDAAPVEVGAVWTIPGVEAGPGGKNTAAATAKSRIQSGHFFVENGQIVTANGGAAKPLPKKAAVSATPATVNTQMKPTEVAAALPARRPGLKPTAAPEPGRNP
jgi:penicillin-binding protein 2